MPTLVDSEAKLKFRPPEPGCILYLPGLPGGGNKLYDRSPYGNNGTITGATWKGLPAGLGYLYFDGSDDEVDLGNPASLNLTGDITWEVWATFAVPGNGKGVFNKDDEGANRQFASIFSKSGTSKLGNVIFKEGGGVSELYGDTVLQADVWYHCVATYKLITDGASIMDLYLNGVPDQTQKTDCVGPLASTSENFGLGAKMGGGNPRRHQGNIALARVYNRVLTALEVQNHFNREKHLFGVW